MPFFNRRPKRQLRDFLMAHADALVRDTLELDTLLAQYDAVVESQVDGLLMVAERLSRALPGVKPSDQFVEQLRRELLAEDALFEQQSWWDRIRRLPPRTQWAAGIGGATITAGVVLIASRPVWDAWLDRRNR
jgi:hypothetical protein